MLESNENKALFILRSALELEPEFDMEYDVDYVQEVMHVTIRHPLTKIKIQFGILLTNAFLKRYHKRDVLYQIECLRKMMRMENL